MPFRGFFPFLEAEKSLSQRRTANMWKNTCCRGEEAPDAGNRVTSAHVDLEFGVSPLNVKSTHSCVEVLLNNISLNERRQSHRITSHREDTRKVGQSSFHHPFGTSRYEAESTGRSAISKRGTHRLFIQDGQGSRRAVRGRRGHKSLHQNMAGESVARSPLLSFSLPFPFNSLHTLPPLLPPRQHLSPPEVP